MIRIENPKVAKFVAEAVHALVKNRPLVENDGDYESSFREWRVGPLFVSVKWDREQGSAITAYTEPDFFFVSYYPEGDYGLLTLGKSPANGWDFGGGVDDPRY